MLSISNILEDDVEINTLWMHTLDDKPIAFFHYYPVFTILGLPIVFDSDILRDHLTNEELMTQTLVESYLDAGTYEPQVARFEMICEHFSYYVSVAYNSTKFEYLSEAWIGNETYDAELWIFIGMGFESEWVSLPTWMIIAQLLTFQAPNIHPIVNGLIAIPLWIAVLYLVYHLLLRLIPFLGGA